MSVRGEGFDAGSGRTDKLDQVRLQLAELVEQRLLAPFSAAEQERYRELLLREAVLLRHRPSIGHAS
jgi:hypothetical protein